MLPLERLAARGRRPDRRPIPGAAARARRHERRGRHRGDRRVHRLAELRPRGTARSRPATGACLPLAVLPSLTEVSRASLFCGVWPPASRTPRSAASPEPPSAGLGAGRLFHKRTSTAARGGFARRRRRAAGDRGHRTIAAGRCRAQHDRRHARPHRPRRHRLDRRGDQAPAATPAPRPEGRPSSSSSPPTTVTSSNAAGARSGAPALSTRHRAASGPVERRRGAGLAGPRAHRRPPGDARRQRTAAVRPAQGRLPRRRVAPAEVVVPVVVLRRRRT